MRSDIPDSKTSPAAERSLTCYTFMPHTLDTCVAFHYNNAKE